MRVPSRSVLPPLALAVVALLLHACTTPAIHDAEAALIRTLQSDAPPAEKDAACVRLKRIGTARSIPALAALLADEHLSHSARHVLEAMSAPEAGRALRDTLPKVSPALRAGIANSLGVRREPAAVPALAAALRDPEVAVAATAAIALGEIAGDDAIRALQGIDAAAAAALRQAADDALLRCAHRRLGDGELARARELFEASYAGPREEGLRLAAFRGILLASGAAAVERACEAISGPAGPEQRAALQLVHELPTSAATVALAALLPRLDAPRQVAVIEGLRQRRDPAAVSAILALWDSPDAPVRIAASNALGELGDAALVGRLANAAARTSGPEQTAAREALVALHRGRPADAMLDQLASAPPAVQAELARALAARRERTAVPRLLALARQEPGGAHDAAVIALARLADAEPAASAALVQLVTEARNDRVRDSAATAFASACRYARSRGGRPDVAPLVAALATGSPEARCALLPACASLEHADIRSALQAALADRSERVRSAAIAALCDTTDAQLLPELLRLAAGADEPEQRQSATRACVRLATSDSAALSASQRLEVFTSLLAERPEAEQQRIVLSGLAGVPTRESLSHATRLLEHSAVREDAARAVLALAPLVPDRANVESALQRVRATVPAGEIRQAAELALRHCHSGFGFLTTWRLAGPYRQEGRDYADLFDFVQKPETDDTQGVKWKPLTTAAGSGWRIDVRDALGALECVGYAQTWIHVPRAEPVRFELGCDHPMKLWLNQALLHTSPVPRRLQPGSDVVEATLRPGWNAVLVKLAQRESGAAFCVRVLRADGEPLDPFEISAVEPAKDQRTSR